MKRALKYTLSALAAAVVAAPAMATVLDNTAVYVAGTLTEASGNGLHITDQRVGGPDPVNGGTAWRPIMLDPDHEWDFYAGFSYRIGGNNTRFFFEYDHFKGDESREVGGTGVSAIASGLQASGVTVTANVQHKERDVKFGLRHTLDFGPKFETVLGAGLEYSKVQRTFYSMALWNGPNIRNSNLFNETEGWGPFVEAKGRAYPLGNESRNWSFWARGALALLYADHTGTFEIREVGPGNPPELHGAFTYFPEDTKSIITRVEADLGIEWNRVMRADFNDLLLGVKVGVRYHNMINAFKNGNLMQIPSTGAAGGGALANSLNTSPNDYGRMGPFLEFKLGGANA